MDTLAEFHQCEVHKIHTPKNLSSEWHHIVPVAWQLHVSPPDGIKAPSPGPDTDGRGMLWDNRGSWICPTGHRNIHIWIVKLMHQIHAQGVGDKQSMLSQAIRTVRPGQRAPSEFSVAVLGLERFMPFGDLFDLTTRGMWGQA